jgi:hypothetical protein
LKTLTEQDVVEAFASSGYRGEMAVLDRFAPHMMQGALTKDALFQIAFHIEDSDMNADRGLLYSAIVLHAATLVLENDTAAWRELRTRPGKLGAFIASISGPESPIIANDRRPIRYAGTVRPRIKAPSAINDLLDIVLSRLNFNFEMLTFLYDHLQDAGMKSIVKSLLILHEKEPVPGSA